MNNHAEFFLGIDGGGSSCRARIRDLAGRNLGEALKGPANIYQDFQAARANIIAAAEEAALQATLPLSCLHAGLGLAGIVAQASQQRLQQAMLPFASLTADDDAFIACYGAFAGLDGGIIIAGTGSTGLCVAQGQRYSTGGWGFQLGDEGSGAWLGLKAVRWVTGVIEGQIAETAFSRDILAKTGQTRSALIAWSEQARSKDYAALAPLIFNFAALGDQQALIIITKGAGWISGLGRALLAQGAHRLCLLGGLAQAYSPYLAPEIRQVLTFPLADAVDGAIMMARQSLGLAAAWGPIVHEDNVQREDPYSSGGDGT